MTSSPAAKKLCLVLSHGKLLADAQQKNRACGPVGINARIRYRLKTVFLRVTFAILTLQKKQLCNKTIYLPCASDLCVSVCVCVWGGGRNWQ